MDLGAGFSIGKECFPSKILQKFVSLPHDILDELFLYTTQALLRDKLLEKEDSSAQNNSPLPLLLIEKCEKGI
jgi:hypothetical protein